MLLVSVDDREDALKPFLDIQTPQRTTDVLVTRLTASDVGVYWTHNTYKILLMAFERKSWDDLATSIKDGRIDRQVEDLKKLRDDGAAVFILVEGRRAAQHARIDSHNLVAKLTHIMIRTSIPVLYTKDPNDTVAKIFEMSDTYPMDLIDEAVAKLPECKDATVGGVDPLVFKREQSIKHEAIAAVGAVPGISYVTAGMLLKHYTPLWILLGVEANDLSELTYPTSGAKIGKKRAEEIIQELDKPTTLVKALSKIKGITTATSKQIVKSVDPENFSETTLCEVPRGKRKLGTKLAKKIMTVLNFKITPFDA